MRIRALWLVGIVLVEMAFCSNPSFADELGEAKALLQRQLQLIQLIQPYVPRRRLGRLFFLRSLTKSVADSIDKKGLGHKATDRAYQILTDRCKHSLSYFRAIDTEDTANYAVEFLKNNERIIDKRGYDDYAYSSITFDTYTDMKDVIDRLMVLPISTGLRMELLQLKTHIGELLGKASGGDKRTLYPLGESVYREAIELYPEFNKIASSDLAFELTEEIQGLNEYYGEFAEWTPNAK